MGKSEILTQMEWKVGNKHNLPLFLSLLCRMTLHEAHTRQNSKKLNDFLIRADVIMVFTDHRQKYG